VLAVDALLRTALHSAAETRDAHEVVHLLGDGNVVDPHDYRHYTPVHLAACVGAVDVVALLPAAGADPAARTAFRTTPLHEAAAGGGLAPVAERLAIIDRLLMAGGPIDAVDTSGRTALWYAAATGTTERAAEEQATRFRVLQLLLDRGADPTIAASGTQGRPVDAAQGMHQAKKYRHAWPDALALLQAARR
jgi:ankyrin repeat protein